MIFFLKFVYLLIYLRSAPARRPSKKIKKSFNKFDSLSAVNSKSDNESSNNESVKKRKKKKRAKSAVDFSEGMFK